MLNNIFFGIALLADTVEKMPEGSILKFDKSMLINIGIQWFNVIVLTMILIFILYKPVKKFMQDRTERIKNDIESARLSKEKALELKANYENLIKNIEKEREEILNQAHSMALEKSDRILFSAHEEAKRLHKKIADEIAVERENAADDTKRQIIELSALMASRFVEVSIDEETQERYIDEALTDWSEELWQVKA